MKNARPSGARVFRSSDSGGVAGAAAGGGNAVLLRLMVRAVPQAHSGQGILATGEFSPAPILYLPYER